MLPLVMLWVMLLRMECHLNKTEGEFLYWNSVHGREKGQAEKDLEGLQTMRILARNMSFLMKSIALGKEKYGMPKSEEHLWTHFISE